jgi:hypothetical protein
MRRLIYTMGSSVDGYIAGADGGTPFFPALDEPINLELVETRTFGSRVLDMRYRLAN